MRGATRLKTAWASEIVPRAERDFLSGLSAPATDPMRLAWAAWGETVYCGSAYGIGQGEPRPRGEHAWRAETARREVSYAR